ncbi:MAG: hypothetical protein AVDCRST_MAG01-01-14, partial [uncultured Rubrobacteraceae bacterium]
DRTTAGGVFPLHGRPDLQHPGGAQGTGSPRARPRGYPRPARGSDRDGLVDALRRGRRPDVGREARGVGGLRRLRLRRNEALRILQGRGGAYL